MLLLAVEKSVGGRRSEGEARGDAAVWFMKGQRDGRDGKIPRTPIWQAVPPKLGQAYALGWRDGHRRRTRPTRDTARSYQERWRNDWRG